MKTLVYSLVLLSSLTVLSQPDVSILEGTWKMEGKEKFEVWQKAPNGLSGYVYIVKEGTEKKTESLAIDMTERVPVYLATVPTQNGGATIPFRLNSDEEEMLSFENPEHDFPVKIQYKPISSDRLFVSVLGSDDKGFSYYVDRVR